ncbi:MAG: glutamate--tRNA ligase [Gemmatimonadota bacterium]|nr:MAG: glutamate--tRNA ligase [Gemmatimonadota bacterium]
MTVRTRFAPSPTGELHLGNARIAVLNWLFARHSGGAFVLRIEDTDVDRNLPGSEYEIMEALRGIGVTWDEGPDVGGPCGPYRQSERGAVYAEQAAALVHSGYAFRCYCSAEELEARREQALARGAKAIYDGRCRGLSPLEQQRHAERGLVPSLRFAVPEEEVVVSDFVRGRITFDPGEFGDFVIMKSDGLPTYNFGVVVDDHGMDISHVIRGVGHLANTPRQVMLYRAFGWEPPLFVHVPHVLSPEGGPLSKRHGARSLREYLEAGYHPDALVNYLSLLSWSSPSGEEILTRERLIGEIDLARLGASDVRLDPDKLEWLSGEHIRGMEAEALAARLAEHLGDRYPEAAEQRLRFASSIRERITTFRSAERFLSQLYPPDPMEWSPTALEAMSREGVPRLLETARAMLRGVEDWDGETALLAIRAAGKAAGLKGRDLFMPVRAALTGATQGPELADILAIQGKATALRVLEQALALRYGSG